MPFLPAGESPFGAKFQNQINELPTFIATLVWFVLYIEQKVDFGGCRSESETNGVTMKRFLPTATFAACALALGGNAFAAYTTYFGEDLNNSATIALTSVPNSAGAETAFKSTLVGVGTENFEGQPTGATSPLPLTFPGAGTATLSGGSGVVRSFVGSNGAGRYSVPQPGSTKFWEVSAGGGGNFTVAFTQAIAAFGFYGVDIGDFGGQLTVDLIAQDNVTVLGHLTVNNTVGNNGSTDGSVLYFGAVAGTVAEDFWSVRFNTTTGSGDIFAFDNFTIASRAQINPNPVPLPGTLALLGLGLLGLGASRRRA